MAKIRLPEKVESKSTSRQSQHISNKFKYSDSNNRSSDDLDDMIDGVQSIRIFKSIIINNRDSGKMIGVSRNNEQLVNLNFVYKKNEIASDDEKSEKLSDEDDANDDVGVIECSSVRAQVLSPDRPTPYNEKFYSPHSNIVQNCDNSTDFDTSAKEILTDCEHRKKIDFCLNKLSDINQGRSINNSFSPVQSNVLRVSDHSQPPEQQQQWQSNGLSANSHRTRGSCCVSSISVCESEKSLLKILTYGGGGEFQSSRTAEASNRPRSVRSSSLVRTSDSWPNSPASNACATSSSTSNSRASSIGTQSPTRNNECGEPSLLHLLGSPMGSPQISLQNFQNRERPFSFPSSSLSYYETLSPVNYQTPLNQHPDKQLGDHVMTRYPFWRENFNTLTVDSVDNSELQLELIEEVIRGDMNEHIKDHTSNDLELRVVPNCRSTSSCSNFSNLNSTMDTNQILSSDSSPYMDNNEISDDLTNTLLKFVRGEQTSVSPNKLETRCSSTTSGYSSSSSSSSSCYSSSNISKSSNNSCINNNNSSSNSQVRKAYNGSCLQIEHVKNNFLKKLKTPTNQLPQQQMVYQQQYTNYNSNINAENLQCNTETVDINRRNYWQSYFEPNSMLLSSSSTNNFTDFQIPETMSFYNSQKTKSSSKYTINNNGSIGKRNIAPWPSLNLPSTRASERLKEVTDPLEVEKAMKNLLKRPLDELAKGDEDGDTMLICLAGNPLELQKKLAYLAPLVERLGTIDGALSTLNLRGEDALYLAAMNCPQMSFVAGYLAAASLQKNIDISQRLYRSRGDTLIHAVAAKGDGHGEVLAELLSLKTPQGNPVFDLSKRNYDGRTALHIAVESHNSMSTNAKIVSIGTVRLLLENGADPLIRDVRCGDTALNLAISLSGDPSLLKELLMGKGQQAVNISNYNGNTPLHMAAMILERTSLERQLEICWILIQAGARTNLTNRQGKTPLTLVSVNRKEALRRVFYKRF